MTDVQKRFVILILLVVVSLLFLFSCKKKCFLLGNGIGIMIALYDSNNNKIPSSITAQIKYYYFKPNGVADTFRASTNLPEIDVVRSGNMKISTGDPLLGIGIEGFTTAALKNEIKGGYLYLLFPDGITDSMKVQVRNVDGCNIDNYNYYIDGLLYNERQAEFTYKRPVGHINQESNAFKAYIH